MKTRDQKRLKIIAVLAPVLLLALFHGYGQIRKVQARRAERRKRAQKQAEQARQANRARPAPSATPTNLAAGAGTRARPSPPPGATPADTHATVPPAAVTSGIRVAVDIEAQNRRMRMPWGRDPFTPPDTTGPRITPPGDLEAPRGEDTVRLRIRVSDRTTGNSGVASAVLFYGTAEPFEEHRVSGTPPPHRNGDGDWTFIVPAPKDRPLGCFVVAEDKGRLRSRSRSPVFHIHPPPKATVSDSGRGVKLTLRGITWAGSTGVALINDQIVGPGEYVQGYEVVKVAKNAVVLRRSGKEICLQLKE